MIDGKLAKQILQKTLTALEDCPLGFAHGRVLMSRTTTEADLHAWLVRFFDARDNLKTVVEEIAINPDIDRDPRAIEPLLADHYRRMADALSRLNWLTWLPAEWRGNQP